ALLPKLAEMRRGWDFFQIDDKAQFLGALIGPMVSLGMVWEVGHVSLAHRRREQLLLCE
ncbi:unnamed protein product, partial [Prorocentrum cordatum]